jgi:ATP-dependent DNA ligase
VKATPVDLRPSLSTMTARPAQQLPNEQHGSRYAFEPKLDGRCLAFHRIGGDVTLQSRQQKALTAYFPEVAASIIEGSDRNGARWRAGGVPRRAL